MFGIGKTAAIKIDKDLLEKVKKYFGEIPAGPPVAKHRAWIAKHHGKPYTGDCKVGSNNRAIGHLMQSPFEFRQRRNFQSAVPVYNQLDDLRVSVGFHRIKNLPAGEGIEESVRRSVRRKAKASERGGDRRVKEPPPGLPALEGLDQGANASQLRRELSLDDLRSRVRRRGERTGVDSRRSMHDEVDAAEPIAARSDMRRCARRVASSAPSSSRSRCSPTTATRTGPLRMRLLSPSAR